MKARQHVGLYRLRQLQNFHAFGTTAIDQNQRLLFIDARRTVATPFPAALIDQPTGGELVAAIRLGLADQLRMLLQ